MSETSSMPQVDDVGDALDLSKLAIEARRWARVNEVVAIVADLKDSTRLGTGGQRAASTASIYEAAVNPLVQTLEEFDADDVAIQGDGAIGVFWGDRRFERAFCAGVTVKTFSQRHLEKRLEEKWPGLPAETGYKVGIAASPVLVKKVGIPRKTDHQEEVWAGKAVNFAAKAAQSANRRELIVTGTVWDILGKNDYIAFSCGCNGGATRTITPRLVGIGELGQGA
jgi:class 3 adenylate cyclase